MKNKLLPFAACLFIILILTGCPGTNFSGTWRVIDHNCTNLNFIPRDAVITAKNELHIAYNHTSHGSQLITGMNALEAYPAYGGFFSWAGSGGDGILDLRDGGIPGIADLSQGDSLEENGYTPWVNDTRDFLDNPDNSEINVIIWSWCSINGHDAQRYVDNMEVLIQEYQEVTFVFMTGHAEGQSEDLSETSVHYNNELIRNHCADHNRILYDFADIEAWDPNGKYYWDLAMYDNLDYTLEEESRNWAREWITANPEAELTRLTTGAGVEGYDGCSGTAHSNSPAEANLNGILKGRGAWWLYAVLGGWRPE